MEGSREKTWKQGLGLAWIFHKFSFNRTIAHFDVGFQIRAGGRKKNWWAKIGVGFKVRKRV